MMNWNDYELRSSALDASIRINPQSSVASVVRDAETILSFLNGGSKPTVAPKGRVKAPPAKRAR